MLPQTPIVLGYGRLVLAGVGDSFGECFLQLALNDFDDLVSVLGRTKVLTVELGPCGVMVEEVLKVSSGGDLASAPLA